MAGKSEYSPDCLPTYAESISSNVECTYPGSNTVARARSALISTLVTTQITPHLHSNFLSGLSTSTLLIVPTNVAQLQPPQSSGDDSKGPWVPEPTFLQETVVGFPSVENLTLIRLQGQENNLGFWCQPIVISDLGQNLRCTLQSEGHHVVGVSGSEATMSSEGWRTIKKKTLQSGEIRVEVSMREINLRIENVMGLYETRTGKAIVVKVEIGG